MNAIGRIAQLEELNISQSVRDDYHYFFNDDSFWRRLINGYERGVFDTINLPEMMKYWPIVAKYIKTHCNLQTRLLQIILEKPTASIEEKPVRMDGKIMLYDSNGKPQLVAKEELLDNDSLLSPRRRFEFIQPPLTNNNNEEPTIKSCGL